MNKLLLTTALLTSLAITPAMAETTANVNASTDIQTNVADTVKSDADVSVKANTNVVVQEKTADVQEDATKVVITETVKTTAGSMGVTGHDKVIEKTADKGVDLHDESKDIVAKVKETAEKSVAIDTETGALTIEKTAKTTIKGEMSTEGLTENGKLTKEGVSQVESVVTEIEADVDTQMQTITPAARTTMSDMVDESVETGAEVKTTETLEITPSTTTSVAVEEKQGFFGKIKGWFN